MVALVHKFETIPTRRRFMIINHANFPNWHVSLTTKPKFPNNAVNIINVTNILHTMPNTGQMKLSLALSKDSWINLSEKFYAKPSGLDIFLMTLVLLTIFLMGNYWLVRRMRQPIQTLLQSLEFACVQKKWTPLPILGDAELQRVFELINILHAKSEDLMKNRSHMLAAISHDLRTPLTRLKLRAEHLQEDHKLSKMLVDIHDMEVMIWETLDYFAEYNRELQKAKFDLEALLNTIIEEEQDKQHDINLVYPEHKITYFANINLLKRAFENIIVNAIQHASRVQVAVQDKGDFIQINFADNGRGIPEEDLAKIGNPYMQSQNSRPSGTGLGLMIAKEVILLHGGTIEFANQMQGGLMVSITLPKS